MSRAKLFQHSDTVFLPLSREDFVKYHDTTSFVSLESLSDYLYKIKDSFRTGIARISNMDSDKITTDTLNTRFEVEHVIKRLKFKDIAHEVVNKPDKFKGKYIDYSQDTLIVSLNLIPNTTVTLNNLKAAISSFMNEYRENNITTIYGHGYFKQTEKDTANSLKTISAYFPPSVSSSRSKVEDLLKSLKDVPDLYRNIQLLDSYISYKKLKDLIRLADECASLTDLLIEQNVKTGILLKNDAAKKDLVHAINTAASQVELVGYIYANTMYFYSAFKDLTDRLLLVGNR